MQKILLALALGLASFYASAGPNLVAQPLPASGPQPTSASITVNGAPGPACTLPKAADGSVQLTCDLASLPASGAFTIVATYTYTSGCVNTANAATCTTGGVASSAPFVLTRRSGNAGGPVLSIEP
jgi:hypothetical protein